MIKEAKKLVVMKNAGKIYDGPTELPGGGNAAEGKDDLEDFEELNIAEEKDAKD